MNSSLLQPALLGLELQPTSTPAIAIIGVSGFGDVHYQDLLRETEQMRALPVAATIINQEQERAKTDRLRGFGCEVFEDCRAMLSAWKNRIDLCLIPTGIHLHKEMTLAALEAGANVLVEKPAAATVQDVDEMIAMERKTGKFAAVGFQYQFGRQLHAMKEAVLQGKIGELQEIRCLGLSPRFSGYYKRNNWAGKIRHKENWILDSPFHNAFAHSLMAMCTIAGDENATAVPISVTAELYRAKLIESCDTAAIRVETKNATLMLFVTHSCREMGVPTMLIRGSRGEIRWRISQGAEVFGKKHERIPADKNLRESMFSALYAKMSGKEAPICDLISARAQTLITNGAFDSSLIHQIPDEAIDNLIQNGEELTAIRDIEATFAEGMELGALPSEMKVSWGRPGTTVPMQNYLRFEEL